MASDDLSLRMSRLEAANRRLWITTSTLMIVIVVTISIGAGTGKPATSPTSPEPLLKDSKGRARVDLVTRMADGVETAGIVFYTTGGDEAGSILVKGDHLSMHFSEAKDVRRVTDMRALALRALEAKAEPTQAETDAVLKRGRRLLALSSRGAVLIDETEEGAHLQGLDGKGLITTAVTIDGTGGTDNKRALGKLRVVNGSVDVEDPATGSRAILGRVQLVNERTGAKTDYPASSLTLLDKDGKVLRQLP
jgi:hypothetical protein